MREKFQDIIDGRAALVIRGLGPYSLRDTLECGQVFRFEKKENASGFDEYIVTAMGRIIDVAQREVGELIFFGATDEDYENVLRSYFSLDTDLDMLAEDVKRHTDSAWLASAADLSRGIAILSQDKFETLISFIISQNNNIPRIKKIIKLIAAEYGVNLTLQNGCKAKCPLNLVSGTPCEEKCQSCGVCYSFPTPIDIATNPEKLLPSHPGFRYKYIVDAAEKVASGEINLDMIAAARSYFHTLECLKQIKGVGDKVASCVALFAFGNLEAFPIDVWMKRAIDTYFGGSLDPTTLGRYAGVAQQYIFHYIRNIENG